MAKVKPGAMPHKSDHKKIKVDKAQASQSLLRIVDWAAKVAAGAFFVAASYGYVSGWLKTHQDQHDLSVAGAIMVVSIALYLYLRKR